MSGERGVGGRSGDVKSNRMSDGESGMGFRRRLRGFMGLEGIVFSGIKPGREILIAGEEQWEGGITGVLGVLWKDDAEERAESQS